MTKSIIIGALLAVAGLAQAAFETTNATDDALIRGGSYTNVALPDTTLVVKDSGTDGQITDAGLRISMLKFDLSGITGTVHAASVNLLQKEPAPYDFYVWTVDHDAPGQGWTKATATMVSVLNSGLFTPQSGLWKANDATLNLIGVKAFQGDGGLSQYNWEPYSSFKNKDLTTYINNAVADGSNTLTLVFGTSTSANGCAWRGAFVAGSEPYLKYSYDPADEESLVNNVVQIGGQAVHRERGWNSFTVSTPDKASLAITNSVDTNLVFTVNIEAGNAADVLDLSTTHIGVDSTARNLADTNNTGRLNLDETVKITVSYDDPNGSMLDLGMSGIGVIWGNNSSETTTVTDASSTTYDMIGFNNDAFVHDTYGTTGLENLTKTNTNTWELIWSATGASTTSGVGAFALKYLTGTLGPAYGEVALGSTWDNSAGLELVDQSASYVSATMTNTVDGTNRRFFQRVSDGQFTSASVQLSETVTVSFTAKIGANKALNGADRVFRGSFWDEGYSAANGLSFRVDYGNVGGTTMELGKGDISSTGYIGNIGDTVSTNVIPTNALVSQGDESDFVLTLKRTGASTADFTLSYDDVTVAKSYTGVNFNSFDALGFRMNVDNENHLIITNLLVEITGGVDTSTFAYWAKTMGLTGVNDDLLDDAEVGGGDGVNNLMEYALGGDPLEYDAADILPVESVDSSYFNYVYSRRTDAATRGLTYDVSSTLDLVLGPITNDTEEAGSVDEGGGFESVTNRVPTATETKQFMELKVGISE